MRKEERARKKEGPIEGKCAEKGKDEKNGKYVEGASLRDPSWNIRYGKTFNT